MPRDIILNDGTKVSGFPDNPTPADLDRLEAMQKGAGQGEGAEPGPGLLGYGKALATGAARGAASLPAFVLDAAQYLTSSPMPSDPDVAAFRVAGDRAKAAGFKKLTGFDMPESASALVESLLPKEENPGTRMAQSVGEGLGSVLAGPGNAMTLGQKVLMGAMGGAGAGVGENLYGPLGAVVGSILGGGGTAIGLARKDNANRLLRQGMSEMDLKSDFAKARRLERDLNEAGVTAHLKSQLLGPRSTVGQIVQQASENPRVLPRLTTHLEKSGEQAQDALSKWRYSELPLGFDSSRQRLWGVVDDAKRSLSRLSGEANDAYVKQLPPDAPFEVMPTERVDELLYNLLSIEDDPRYLGRLSTKVNFIRDSVDKISDLHNTVGVRQGDVEGLAKELQDAAQKEGVAAAVKNRIKEAFQDSVPDYEPARNAKTAFMRGAVDSAKRGLIGDAARTKAPLSLTSKFFPRDSTQVTEIQDFGRQVGAEALGSVLDEHISKVANAAFRKPLTGPAQIQEFTTNLMGTAAQRKNVYAALDSLSESAGTDPRATRVGFAKLLRGLETFSDAQVGTQLNRVALEQEAGRSAIGMATALQSRFARFVQLGATAKAYEKIGKIVTSPDGLKQLEAIANTKDPKLLRTFVQQNLLEVGRQVDTTNPESQ